MRQKGIDTLKHWLHTGTHNVNPGWFSCIMGTGILAICMAKFPHQLPFFASCGGVLWGINLLLFLALLVLWVLRIFHHPLHIRDSLLHPQQAQQWGSPPTACFTIATGCVILGESLPGYPFCLIGAHILWFIGITGSLFSAMMIPYLMFTRHEITMETTYGNWLVPIAPIIGASVPGSLLVYYWPEFLQIELVLLSFVLWGSGITLASIIIVLFYARLAYHKAPKGILVPTMWLVIGPLGQSISGLTALGKTTRDSGPPSVQHYRLRASSTAFQSGASVSTGYA